MAKIEVGQRTTALDLAQALEGNEGTFHCQQSGQAYVAVAKPGHSITSLRPVGRRFVEPTAATVAQEPWLIEKISNQEMSFEEAGTGRR
jgi:hypothetical protein